MSEQKLRVISIIYSESGYSDRMRMILSLGSSLDRHIILSSSSLEEREDCEIISPSGPMRAHQFWSWAAQQAAGIIEASEGRWIVHEYITGITSYLLKRKFGQRVYAITSAYSIEIAFLRERGWRRDPYSRQFISWKQTAQWLRISLKCALVRWAGGRGNDLFLGNSTAVAQDIQRLFPKKKTAVIKTAIDTNVFRPTLKKEQANSSGTFQLLYAGRINPPKGIGLLFHCLQQLHKEGVDFRLKIIGQYWPFEKEWFENMSAHYEADQYTDYIPRLPREELIPELSSADLLVLPSLYEGSPRIVKEALACGTQVLCTDIPGTHVLDPKGDILHFFQENNASDFLEKLRALMAQKGSEEWNQRIRSGVEWVRSYSHQQVSQQLIDLYEQILQIRKHESIH